jgi:DNA modification methylase
MSLSKKQSKATSSRSIPKKAAKKQASSSRSTAVEPKKTEVKISAAKGRPMLIWVGKHPLQRVTAFPAQLVEKFDPIGELDKGQKGGLLFHGDNKEVLAYLLSNGYRGKVNLVYIDPPFDSGADYVRKISLRGVAGAAKLDGESYELAEQIQYTDIWANDNYLQFMYERLSLLKELLAEGGSIFLHCDDVKNYLLRGILEELFPGSFRNEIIWKRTTSTGLAQKRCGTLHDTIYWYTKGDDYRFNMQYHQYEKEYLERAIEDEHGRLYIPIPTGNPGPRPNLYYEYKGYWPHPNGYKWTRDKMEEFDRQGKLIFPKEKTGRIQFKQYVDEMEGVKLQDIWTDVYSVNPVAHERIGYPTQKPEALLDRIVMMATNTGDLVLDAFVGSGTTAAVAQKLGRKWIAADINKGAVQTTMKRVQAIISEQIGNRSPQGTLIDIDKEETPPTQLSFAVYRVNDYDLQIQHNEAVNLACEHIGIKRTKSDSFFDGELGKKLVKIVPFNHPLSPVDLEEIKKELDVRPEDERDVVVVSLGKELAVDGWLEDWNRYRKNRNVPNKIELIELRSDERYGKFFEHKPAKARVGIQCAGDKIKIRIVDFVSPTILERLEQQAGVLTPHVEDWRSMVDSIMIDTAYNGRVFNVVYADVPERKSDLVVGEYELDAPKKKTTVAVKITDMLGEEVLETGQV